MARIHPTSIVSPQAEIAESVEIGPFCIIEPGVVIGADTKIASHSVFKTGTTVGERNTFAEGVIIGGEPQDRKFKGEDSYLKIGDDNIFREYVTLHRASGEGLESAVGNRNFLMAYVHLGHNSTITDDCTIANSVGISGHVTIEPLVTVGGMTGIHQFVRVGKSAMVGGLSKLTRDVAPFMIVQGDDVKDINAVGLRRLGVDQERRLALHKAARLLFKSQLGLTNAIEVVKREVHITEEVDYLIEFLMRIFQGKNGRGDQR